MMMIMTMMIDEIEDDIDDDIDDDNAGTDSYEVWSCSATEPVTCPATDRTSSRA